MLTREAFIQAIEVLSQRQTREFAPQPQQPLEPCNTITNFKKLSPPSFCGSIDPLEVEKWLTEIEKTFSVFYCSEEKKVSRAAYMLQGDVHDWWLMVTRQHEDDTDPYTWKMFRDAFYDKYFPKSIHKLKEREFTYLQQWSKTATKYEAEFNRLAKFSQSLIPTKESRARHFEEGLRTCIK